MFPTRFPLYTYAALALSLVFAFASFLTWKRFAPSLQVYYLTGASHYIYVTSGVPRIRQTPQRYLVFTDAGYLATDRSALARLLCVPILATPAALHDSLARQVYGGLEVTMRWPIRAAGGFALLALIYGSSLDRKRRKRFREGIWLRGPKIVSPRAYNRQNKGDGIGIELT